METCMTITESLTLLAQTLLICVSLYFTVVSVAVMLFGGGV